MSTLRIREVDGKAEPGASLLRYLQLTILPADVPSDTSVGWWWVALDGDLPVAFAGLVPSRQVPDAGYLCRAGVLPSHRGRGLQKRLLRARERKAKKLHLVALVSDTYDNPPSSNNLIAAGFRQYEPPLRYGAVGTNYWRKPL